jgi:hypothetical protein
LNLLALSIVNMIIISSIGECLPLIGVLNGLIFKFLIVNQNNWDYMENKNNKIIRANIYSLIAFMLF